MTDALRPGPVAAWLLLALLAAPAGAQEGAEPAVVVERVVVRELADVVTFVGRVEAERAADVVARVEGLVVEAPFAEGSDVAEGELLFRIEPMEFEAEVALARAELAGAEATARETQEEFDRTEALRERGAATEAALSAATGARDAAAAARDAAAARLEQARIRLGRTEIRAPIAGRIGARAVSPGNLVGPATGPLARIVQLDPVRVVYSVAETDLVAAKVEMAPITQEALNARFRPVIELPGGGLYPEEGTVDFVGNEVDPGTGTVPVRAAFPNRDAILLPGQFVEVRVGPAEPERMATVPVTAVQRDREGPFVYVVGGGDVAERRRIEAGARFGALWAVEAGLEPGERVVTEGLQKVRPGASVTPAETVVPTGAPEDPT